MSKGSIELKENLIDLNLQSINSNNSEIYSSRIVEKLADPDDNKPHSSIYFNKYIFLI